MRILHYITNFTHAAGPQTQMVRAIMVATSKVAENVLVTCVPLDESIVSVLEEQGNVKVRQLHWSKKRDVFAPMKFLFSVDKAIKSVRPDVVHVHGAWDWRAAMVERLARHHSIVSIVSLHRGLSPELVGIDFWKEKLPKLIAYQIWMVRNCTAVIADNKSEYDIITSLLHKKRVELLPASTDDGDYIEQLRKVLMGTYRKCLDTVYGNKLTRKEHNVVMTAVRAYLADDDIETPLPNVEGVSYRRIFFHAYDEDVTELFIEGCKKMRLTLPPPLDMEKTPRYRNPKAKERGALGDAKVSLKNIRIPEEQVEERNAVTLICIAKHIGMSRLTLRRYAELYRLFRHTDFNEDVVMEELKRLRAVKFTKKLQKHIEETFALRHGYSITPE